MKIFLVVISTLLFLFITVILPIIGIMPDYSDGQRTGDIYKFSKKGIFWKSYEGEMYLGGMVSDGSGGLQMEKFRFSIPKEQFDEKQELIDKLTECQQNRDEKCTVEYKQWFISPIEISSRYVVEDVIIN
jgi:hypothetical protein